MVASSSKINVTTGNSGGNTVQCGEITINYGSGSIQMQGQNGNNYFFKIHDLNNGWAEVFSCGYNCGSNQTANNLPNGRYLVRVYNSSWGLICEQEINLNGGSTSDECGFVANGTLQRGVPVGGVCVTENNSGYKINLSSPRNSRSVKREVINLGINGQVGNIDLTEVSEPLDKIYIGKGNHYYTISEEDLVLTLTKKNLNGGVLWSKNYTINNNDPNKSVTGFRLREFDNDILISAEYVYNNLAAWRHILIKTDLNGNEITRGLTNPIPELASVVLIEGKAKDGGYYISNAFGFQRKELIKIDASGNEQWTANLGVDLPSVTPYFIGETPDGTGVYHSRVDNQISHLVKLRTSNGTVEWTRLIAPTFTPGLSEFTSSRLFGGAPTSDGGIVVGFIYRVPPSNPWIQLYGKVDTNGNLVWKKSPPASLSLSMGTAIHETADGGYLFLQSNFQIVKITSDGSITPDCGGGGSTGGNTIECGEMTLKYTANSIEMTGQAGKNYNYKIHDLNNGWAEAFSCTYQCGSSQTANNLASSNYLVKIFNANWNLICEQEISLGASAREKTPILETFTVYPNPAQEEIFLDLKEYVGEKADISISNIYGQVVTTKTIEKIPSEVVQLPLDSYVNGFYLINIRLKNKRLRSEKFLVKRLY